MAHDLSPPDDESGVPFDAVREALDVLEAACSDVLAAIESVAPPQRAFEIATEFVAMLTEAMNERTKAAGDVRAMMVARIWKAEELSLAHLAERVGISKARADQMTRAAKAAAELRKD